MRQRAAIFLHLPWELHDTCAKKKKPQVLHPEAHEHVRTRSRLTSVAFGACRKLMRVMQTLGPHAYTHATRPSPHCEGSVNRQKLRRIHRRTGDSMPHSFKSLYSRYARLLLQQLLLRSRTLLPQPALPFTLVAKMAIFAHGPIHATPLVQECAWCTLTVPVLS